MQADFEECGMLSESITTWASRVIALLTDQEEYTYGDNNTHLPGTGQGMQPDEGYQEPNDPDCGPIDTRDITHRVILARTPRMSLLSLWVTSVSSLLIERGYPKTIDELSQKISVPSFRHLVFEYLESVASSRNRTNAQIKQYIQDHFRDRISVFHSAMAIYYAPSDPSGIGNMHHEYIRSTPAWRGEGERRDCILVNTSESEIPGSINGLEAARVMLFFSFKFRHKTFRCALIQWFPRVGNEPDCDTGMWVVRPEFLPGGRPELQVIHIDTIARSAHLLPIFNGSEKVRTDIHTSDTLDCFRLFYLSKWADHHSFDILYNCT